MACGILVPQPRIEPESPALQGRFLTPGPPGKPHKIYQNVSVTGYHVTFNPRTPSKPSIHPFPLLPESNRHPPPLCLCTFISYMITLLFSKSLFRCHFRSAGSETVVCILTSPLGDIQCILKCENH